MNGTPKAIFGTFALIEMMTWALLIAAKREDQINSDLAIHTYQIDQENLELTKQVHELSKRIEKLTTEVHEAVKAKE